MTIHPLDKWKMIFGFTLLLILGLMGISFGHAKVESNTSFGLMPVITTLSTLAGAFAQWAFGGRRTRQDTRDDDEAR